MRTSSAFAATFAAVAAGSPATYTSGLTYASAKPPKMPTMRYRTPAIHGRRTRDDSPDECDEPDEGDRCEGRPHARNQDRSVPAADVTAHVANRETRRCDEHQRA